MWCVRLISLKDVQYSIGECLVAAVSFSFVFQLETNGALQSAKLAVWLPATNNRTSMDHRILSESQLRDVVPWFSICGLGGRLNPTCSNRTLLVQVYAGVPAGDQRWGSGVAEDMFTHALTVCVTQHMLTWLCWFCLLKFRDAHFFPKPQWRHSMTSGNATCFGAILA